MPATLRFLSVHVLVGCALALTGCAGLNRSMEYGSNYVVLNDPALPHAFWVFDKPLLGRALINVAPGAAMVEGATLCLGANCGAEAKFLKAADLWFQKTGRVCSVSSGALILAPTNYEVNYTCAAAPAATPATEQKTS